MAKKRLPIEPDTEEYDFKEIIRKGKYRAGFMLLYDEDGIHMFIRWKNSDGRKAIKPLFDLIKSRFGYKTYKENGKL